MQRIPLLTVVLLLGLAPAASAMGKGTSLFSVGIANGTADLYSLGAPGYITAYDHSEIAVQGNYWMMMSDDYAFTLSGGVGFFGETDEPLPDSAAAGAPKAKYSQSSFSVRVGGDRVAKIGERAILYFGPGIEFWTGKSSFENILGPGKLESENVTRISISSRLGGHMMIGPNWGFTLNFDRKWGYASVEDAGAKATWWPSSMAATAGMLFAFGGD